MKRAVIKLIVWYLTFVVIFVVMKVIFILANGDIYVTTTLGDYWDVIRHGLPMDCSTAGYFTVIPALLILARQWVGWHGLRVINHIYAVVVALVIGLAAVADTVLYGFWDFKLDMTPVFYFASSPSAALASVTGGYIFWCVVGWIAFSFVIWMALNEGVMRIKSHPPRSIGGKWAVTGVMVLMLGALFVAIRGGVTVSTMNLSSAYYSEDVRLNHAAVNPIFSFLYSAFHQSDDASRFKYMDEGEADELLAEIMGVDEGAADSVSVLNTRRPDIYVVILESFSSYVMPELGGEAIAVGVDSIAKSGVMFTRHFASGFRTDRAIPAILSGYPSLPTASVMKEVAKCEGLPSLTRTLVDNGYEASYYYGGDANFTNMRAYLLSSGFSKVVSDSDFPVGERLSKWGAPDHLLMRKVSKDEIGRESRKPRMVVVQTSSSHEPFKVPYANPRFAGNERANAMAYTDSCVTDFVNRLRQSPQWDKSLVILVADHYGAYPEHVSDPLGRHKVPLIMTGGALATPSTRYDIPMSQNDIAATLLGQMGIDHSRFKFSRDVFASGARHAAFFSNPNFAGWVTPTDTIIYDFNAKKVIGGTNDNELLKRVQAYMQSLYTDFEKL